MNDLASCGQSLPIGVVVERRLIDNKWQDYSWSPVAVIPGAPPMDPSTDVWKLLREGDDWSHFHVGTLNLELFVGETEGYRSNLSGDASYVYVVLTKGEEADEPEVMPFLVTVCPYEAESYTEGGEEIVEGVPMPDEIVAWVQAFIDEHHVDVPFKKRKQKKAYDPRKGDFKKPPPRAGRDRLG
jgi:hypothetical protein